MKSTKRVNKNFVGFYVPLPHVPSEFGNAVVYTGVLVLLETLFKAI